MECGAGYYISKINFDGTVTCVLNDSGSGGIETITTGGGLTGGGSTSTVNISHADTSSRSSVNNSGRTVIQDITLDTYGHLTGLASATLSDTRCSSSGTCNQICIGTDCISSWSAVPQDLQSHLLSCYDKVDPAWYTTSTCYASCASDFVVTEWSCAYGYPNISGTTVNCVDYSSYRSRGSGICTRLGPGDSLPPVVTHPISCYQTRDCIYSSVTCSASCDSGFVVTDWSCTKGNPTISGTTARCVDYSSCPVASGSGTCSRVS